MRDYDVESELGVRHISGPVIIKQNGANKIVWWVAATVVSLILVSQGYIDVIVLDTHTEVVRMNQIIADKLK